MQFLQHRILEASPIRRIRGYGSPGSETIQGQPSRIQGAQSAGCSRFNWFAQFLASCAKAVNYRVVAQNHPPGIGVVVGIAPLDLLLAVSELGKGPGINLPNWNAVAHQVIAAPRALDGMHFKQKSRERSVGNQVTGLFSRGSGPRRMAASRKSKGQNKCDCALFYHPRSKTSLWPAGVLRGLPSRYTTSPLTQVWLTRAAKVRPSNGDHWDLVNSSEACTV